MPAEDFFRRGFAMELMEWGENGNALDGFHAWKGEKGD